MSHDPGLDAPILTIEEAYVGSLLWLDLPAAREAHGWLIKADLASPVLQLVHRMVGQLVANAVRPDPAMVLNLAMSCREVVGEHQVHLFTGHLCRLYDHRATNPASVHWYAAAVLEDAIRRRTVEMTTRVAQVAGHAGLDEIERLTAAEQSAIDAIRARRRALLPPEGHGLAA